MHFRWIKLILLLLFVCFSIQNVLANQLAEQQHDEEKLKTILDDLSKLRHDMTKTNYFDWWLLSKPLCTNYIVI